MSKRLAPASPALLARALRSRKWIARAAAPVLAIGLLAGCGDGAAPPARAFRAGLSTDTGGLNDEAFNAAAWRGLMQAGADLGFEVMVLESKSAADYEPNFRTLTARGCDLIWGLGPAMYDAIYKVANENPNREFAIVDAVVVAPNIASVVFKEQEGSFLVGIIAARATRTRKVGFVGGIPSDAITRFEEGFVAGVKTGDPTVTVIRVYANTFSDPAKGKAIAQQIFSQGADVIFQAAGATGLGVIEAAKEANQYAIGVDSDQNKLAPDNVLSSMIKRVDAAVYNVSKAAAEGSFPGGKTTVLGLKENGVGYSDTTLWNKMPEGTKALVDQWAGAIKAGQVQVPDSPGGGDAFVVPAI